MGSQDTQSAFKEAIAGSGMAIFSVVFLIIIACGKTLMTKAAFKSVEFDYPVILSGMSCLVTDIGVMGVWGTGLASASAPKCNKIVALCAVTLMTALGMAFQNLALNMLSVALQQALRAMLPVVVVLFERLILAKAHNPMIYVALVPLVVGPMLCLSGSKGGDATVLGLVYMSLGVFMSALKVVYLYKIIKSIQKEMNMISFLFWLDLLMIPILLPWAYLNGELSAVSGWEKSGDTFAWSFLIAVSLMGGFRAYSINLVVQYASALTKTAADIFTQALTIYASLLIFHTQSTWMLHLGIGITVAGFGFYGMIKYKDKMAAKSKKSSTDKLEQGEHSEKASLLVNGKERSEA